MIREKVYIETSVISYLTARPSRDVVILAKQELTRDWWEKSRHHFDLYISTAVLDEIREGDPEASKRRMDVVVNLPRLSATGSVDTLLELLLSAKAVPNGAILDAFHIAVAAVYGMSYLLTWNCKHINNAAQKRKIATILANNGYAEVAIATPEELWR